MSNFLPENLQKPSEDYLKPPLSVAGNLSPDDRALWKKLNASVTDLTPEFKAWLVDYVLVNVVPLIPPP